ncbi:MAG: hypothetical protein JWP08_2420 [Bryobacterales bacterium]|jgi:hypothetical protein|nr:hypothetical protein [Bryobacterales bacterium]
MSTINEQEFRTLCEEVRENAPVILQGLTDPDRKTGALLIAVFQRVCEHLHLDAQAQMASLEDRDGFALLQTLEEHMQPEFFYSNIIDHELLSAL